MIQIGAGKTLARLDEMLTDAINGEFEESRYDETELSRLESRWKQYLSVSQMSMEQTQKEREDMKALVSDISHQTKTPLSNILLYADLLLEKIGTGSERQLAEQIRQQTEKLEFLIQALVKMSRLESNVLEIVPKRQILAPVLLQVTEEMKLKAEKKNIQIQLLNQEKALETEAVYDIKWTAEAVGNLLDNAVKYSPENSEILIEIKAYEFYLCIAICDRGIGISEAERAQIFERFYRSERVQQEEGIGIGLYLARQILQKEGGYIRVQAREGGGSIFSVYLPRNEM